MVVDSGRSQVLCESTLPVDHVTPAYGGDPLVPVHVDEEGPEPLKMKVNLGGDVWRTHALYHEGFVAIHPHWEAVGSRIQTVRAFREGNLGSYDPLFRPFSVTRLPAPFTEETFREWNRYQLAASTLAVVANSGESDLKRATPRSSRVAFSSRRGNGVGASEVVRIR